ncbi:protein translocase subunit SecF [Candidatus Formimonas warabiya]|uniref:Protein-export membrane protein SecF n=1 Tax=Formimonas warabiya TaxID=1761012 RepID=A0A3G1KN90_FORW1|nr:protein translocase subunit SecF [Candidatus Formimonas warabiya]ATW23961.1 protein-export membrane protein SecF [Candidatus Formimonas warabiya]
MRYNFNFNIIGKRKWWYAISLLIIIPGIISLFIQGLNLGIDFTGGNLMEVRFTQEVNSDQVRSIFSQYVKGAFSIQETGANDFLIQTGEISEKANNDIRTALTADLGKNEVLRNEHVGPVVGRELTSNALWALLVATVLMLIYITIRFEFTFGVAAVLALLHDVLVLLGAASLLRFEVDSSFVAVVLTIYGYSIMDTIVIFDRIRENVRKGKRGTELEGLVNTSIMQTLARSINTVLTVVCMLVALLLFGGDTTKIFSLALLIGVLTGCYSSICVASPLWLDVNRLEKRTKLA